MGKSTINGRFPELWGYPIAGRFISGKIPSRNRWKLGGSPILGNLHMSHLGWLEIPKIWKHWKQNIDVPNHQSPVHTSSKNYCRFRIMLWIGDDRFRGVGWYMAKAAIKCSFLMGSTPASIRNPIAFGIHIQPVPYSTWWFIPRIVSGL